jgi:hypothetical protein
VAQRRIEVALALQGGVRRRVEVGRAAEERRHRSGDRVHHLAAGDPRGEALGVGREGRHGRVPAFRQRAAQAQVELAAEVGKGPRPGVATRVPVALGDTAALQRGTEMRARLIRNEERGLDRPAELLLRLLHVLDAERRAVRLEAVLLRGTEAEMGADEDQGRPRRVGFGGLQRRIDRVDVVAVVDGDRLPPVGLEALRAILGKRHVGAGRERHRVVVVEADQLAEAEVARRARRLRGDAFHQVAVADDRPGAVVEQHVAVAVVARRQMRLGDRHADGVGEPLAERAGGDLDAFGVAALGMARRLAAPLAELLDVLERERVARHVQQAVEQRRAVSGREDEAVAVGPERMRRDRA